MADSNHDSRQAASATEPIAADRIRVGDLVLLDDGTPAAVTDVTHGLYWFPDGREHGVAIGWRTSASSSGVLFRKPNALLSRRTP